MRTTNFWMTVCLALVAACTPLTPNKAKDNSKCFTNADCTSGYCAKGVCTANVDCAQDANASNALCQDRACVVDADCPSSSYYCGGGRCVFGEKPPCVSNDDCSEAKPFCLVQGGETNLCVECLKPSQCKEGSCIDFACVVAEEACTTNADCKDNADGLLFCEKKSKACVECLAKKDCATKGPTFDCREFKCSDATVVQDCTTNADCPQKKLPICVASTGDCVGCANAPNGLTCPAGKMCDATPASSTFNECVTDTQMGACGSNADCTMGLPPTAPTGSTLWCDQGAIGVPSACKECRLNQNDCGNGFACATQTGGIEVCVPQVAPGCNTAADCVGDDASCVAGACGTACTNPNQCKAGKQCVGGLCQSPATCTTNADCETGGNYNGLTCRGAPLSCQPCNTSTDCTNGPGGAVGGAIECNQTTKTCIVPPVTASPLGATCTNNADCTSGVCHKFASNYPGLCTSLCTRTATTASEPNNDCPTAPAAALTSAGPARAGAAPLAANQGFTCATVSGSPAGAPAFDGLGLCLHAVDDVAIYGTTGISGVSGVYTLPSGAAAVSGSLCQFGYLLNSTTCAAGCGTNTDCDSLTPAEADDYVCRELLTQVDDTEVALGLRYCSQNTSVKGEGEFCDQASDCRENFCAGTCVATRVQRLPIDTCSTNAGCVAGDLCLSGRCYRPTLRAGSSCADDSECSGSDRCWNGKCYAPEAETDRRCQDRYSCGDSTLQFCAGRCASHCNEQSDCAAAPDQVCAYAPGAPGYNLAGNPTFVDGFVGESWARICSDLTPPSAGAAFDHFLPRGGICDLDTECESQVCADNRCTDFCGRSSICEAGETCTLIPRSVEADNASSIVLLMPVCVIP